MKRVLLLVMLFLAVPVFAQEEDHPDRFSLGLFAISEGEGLFFSWERPLKFTDENASIIFRATGIGSTMELTAPGIKLESVGLGRGIAFGSRQYFSKEKKLHGLYYGNYLKYASIKYSEEYYKGRYSYLTFFAPEIGWKPAFGSSKRFFVDVFIGTEWAIEIAGKGDVDNKDFDNWKPKFGLGVGYAF